MLEEDSSQFAKLIMSVSEIYRLPFSSTTIEIYWRLLERFSIEDVSDAIHCHMEVCKYPPTPADIIMAIGGSPKDQASLAWTKTADAIKFIGGHASVAFDDALIHAVIKDMGNWIKLCDIEDKQMPFSQKEFQERYRRYINKNPPDHPKYLIGRIEHYNSTHGYSYPSPLLIGNALKAKEVIVTGVNTPFLEITTEKIDFKNLAVVCLSKNKEITQQI